MADFLDAIPRRLRRSITLVRGHGVEICAVEGAEDVGFGDAVTVVGCAGVDEGAEECGAGGWGVSCWLDGWMRCFRKVFPR